jgi:hypothetical protein
VKFVAYCNKDKKKIMMYSNYHTCSVDNRELLKCCYFLNIQVQGFQSGTVPGTFTRLRSCIVPAEITEPPKISGGQNHKYMVDRLVEYFS